VTGFSIDISEPLHSIIISLSAELLSTDTSYSPLGYDIM